MQSSKVAIQRVLNGLRSGATHVSAATLLAAVAILAAGCEERPQSTAATDTTSSGTPATATTGSDSQAVATTPAAPKTQEEIEQIFNSSTALLAEARTSSIFSQFRPIQQAQLTPAGEMLRVTATGDDPRMLLPAFIQGKKFVVQATVESPVATPMQIFYLTQGQTEYTAEQSQMAQLVQGRNVVYFMFDIPNMIDPLRVDVGAAPGEYIVDSMIARTLPGQ
jgi:hypothetical protein